MATQSSPREMGETVTRMTKEGRKLTYNLTVIQQPERARACGSGAKSTNDRRPVDPPPVVELRIFEGDAKNDITFSYNANFFLFATLELARPIMHGRVQPSAQQIPVLTGMPVSGMAYLDRPSEAGYFIFPDLSVRHEGKYRLSFNLYEETKDAKDYDVEGPSDNQSKPPPPRASTPNGSFDWRLEVKSAPFTVYSAKKFPGLAESTVLSRTVAEQGCRVRIRRDVRMRRRDGKASGDFDEYDDDYQRRRTATPESIHDAYARQRSVSISPGDRQPYVPEMQRRPPGAEYPPQPPYPSGYAPSPVTPQSGSTSYLSFGSSSSQFSQPAPQFTQPAPPAQPMQTQQSYQPAPSAYHQPSSYRQASTPANYSYPERQPYSNQYGPQRENYESDYRRATVAYPPVPPPAGNQYPPADQNYNRSQSIPSYQQYPPRAHTPSIQPSVNLAPLKMPPLEPKYEGLSSPAGPLSGTGRVAPSLPSPSYHERPNSYSHYPKSTPAPIVPELARSSKRTFDSVFNTTSFTQPLHNGMRPSSSHHSQDPTTALDDDDDSVSMETLRMQYKRADGTSYSRELPVLE